MEIEGKRNLANQNTENVFGVTEGNFEGNIIWRMNQSLKYNPHQNVFY